MNFVQSIWDKLTRLVLVLLVIAAVLAISLWYRPVVEKNQRMRQSKLALEKKIDEQAEINRKLHASLRAMQDPRTIERLAREQLNYAKAGETVVHFDPPPSTHAGRY